MSEELLFTLAAGSFLAVVYPIFKLVVAAVREKSARLVIEDDEGRLINISAKSLDAADLEFLRRFSKRGRTGADGHAAT